MSFHECSPDCSSGYVLTEKGRRVLQWASTCEHYWQVRGRTLICKWCSAEYVLTRSTFGGSGRDSKGD